MRLGCTRSFSVLLVVVRLRLVVDTGPVIDTYLGGRLGLLSLVVVVVFCVGCIQSIELQSFAHGAILCFVSVLIFSWFGGQPHSCLRLLRPWLWRPTCILRG